MLAASGKQRQHHLVHSTDLECKTLQIGDPWASGSPLDCYAECMGRFPDSCQSAVYNADKQTCTPGSTAFGHLINVWYSIPKSAPTDTVLYARPHDPPCDIDGFSLHTVFGTTACLYLSTSQADYSEAVKTCGDMGSTLVIANTLTKYSLTWHVVHNIIGEGTWIGLNDRATENTYVWLNGEVLSSDQYSYIWDGHQPDPNGDCIAIPVGEPWGVQGVNYLDCSRLKRYICEPL